MHNQIATHAIVRDVPASFHRAITPRPPEPPIDIAVARQQHERYCDELQGAGLSLIRLPADDRYPDCVFVEDAAVVIGDRAVIPLMGAPARRGETTAVAAALSEFKSLHHLTPPATLDGGDVLVIDRTVFVGLSGRTNRHAVRQLQNLLGPDGYQVVPVNVSGVLHLKSACTHLADDLILLRPGPVPQEPFHHFRPILVDQDEAHAANCLALGRRVLVPIGAPRVRARIEAAGFDTRELDVSEARKAGAGLTCSSILLTLP